VAVASQLIRRAAGMPVIVGVSAPGFATMRTLAGRLWTAATAGFFSTSRWSAARLARFDSRAANLAA